MRLLGFFLLALLPAVFSASPAGAVTLASGLLQSAPPSRLGCVISNIGTKEVTVEATLPGLQGQDRTVSNGCTEPVAPGASCILLGSDTQIVAAYCKAIVSSGKVRGSLAVVSGSQTIDSLPLTK